MQKKILSFFLFLNIFTTNSYAKLRACDLWQDLRNEKHAKIFSFQENLFKKISNTRVFYNISDQLLSKASEKSKKSKEDFLTKWAATSQLGPDNQSVIIQEWRKQFFIGVILPSYLRLSNSQKSIINNAFKELHKFTFPKEVKDSYQQIFEQAKYLSYKLIDSQELSKEIKIILKGNIASIQLNWIDKIEGSQFTDDPSRYFDTDIEFNPKYKVITIGQQAARYTDGDTILSILIQQMAQIISPCRWSILYGNKPFPYQGIVECLKKPSSIYAKSRDDSKIDLFLKEKKISKEQKEKLLMYPTCNTPFYPPNGIQHDQINISFTDWFSAEAMSHFNKLSPNFREDLCSIHAYTTLQSYPPNYERLVRIYFSNKKIRDLLNVEISKDIVHCSL